MINFTHKVHPRSRSIKITIKPNREVVVSSPRFTPQWRIKQFVNQNESWIKKQQAKLQTKDEFGETTNSIKIFGKTYSKKVNFQSTQRLGVEIKDQDLIINPHQENSQQIKREVDRFLKSTATKYILPRTKQLADKMNISFNKITLRQQKTRWGSCSSQGNLNFNWRLVHCPPLVIDYVIIHELAHRQEMNHSQKFWDLVKKYDPEYLKHRGWLKRNGLTLG